MDKAKFLQKFINNNPRNIERLRLQRKPDGWDFEKNRAMRSFIYRVELLPSKKHTEAHIIHYEEGTVLEATTREKSVRSQLYSCSDVNAAYNIGRLLARRCKMSGILNCTPGDSPEEIEKSDKRKVFFAALKEGGIELNEPTCIPHTHLNDPDLVWEPFTIKHTREDKLDELDLSLEPGKGVC